MWKQAVEKTKSVDTDKVIAAMAGQTFTAPSGVVSKTDEKDHHLHKSVFIGEFIVRGQGKNMLADGLRRLIAIWFLCRSLKTAC